jgi:hypothetical protein
VFRVKGFRDFPEAWEGPAEFNFSFHTGYPRTARYTAELEGRAFDLHLPWLALPSPVTPPQVRVAIARARSTLNKIETGSRERAKNVDLLVYSFSVARAGTKLFSLYSDGQLHSLSVPVEAFAGEPHPDRLFVWIVSTQATEDKILLLQTRGFPWNHPEECAECRRIRPKVWKFEKSNFGRIFLCARCVQVVKDRSFDKVDALTGANRCGLMDGRGR